MDILIAKHRYFQSNETSWPEMVERVVRANIVNESESTKWLEPMTDMILNMYFIPAGRILRNSGKPKGNLLNCHVVPIGDSIEEIGTCLKDSLCLWSEGGGVGINFSFLRPKGAQLQTKGGISSGLVSFLRGIDKVASTIESGGQRRAAAIAIVRINHPEALDFIDAKLLYNELSHFNISIAIDSRFLQAVKRGQNWHFTFQGREWGESIPAIDIWNRIITNMLQSAEPGIINWDYLKKNNSWYFAPIIATNPCGELPLSGYESCCLGSLVLPNFLNEDGIMDWDLLSNTIYLAVRFLDNVIDINHYSIQVMGNNDKRTRRIGLGIMGLADYFFIKQLRYGSEASLRDIDELFNFIKITAYEASVKLAQEKGSFGAFDRIDYPQSSFIKKLPHKLQRQIKKHGTRNVTILTCPPTGTTSLLVGVNSGVEPLYSKAYKRNDKLGERIYIHPLYLELLKYPKRGLPDWYVDSFDLTPEEHFETQIAIQKHIDGSISKTINLPSDTAEEQLSDYLIEYLPDLKGVTVYRDGSRDEQVLYRLDKRQAIEYIEKHPELVNIQCQESNCKMCKG